MGQIQDLQRRTWKNKQTQGFNTTNIDREFNYTYAELAEAYDAYRKGLSSVGEELADTMIFLMGLAEILGIDLETEVLAKMKKNEQREYQAANGHHIKKEKS